MSESERFAWRKVRKDRLAVTSDNNLTAQLKRDYDMVLPQTYSINQGVWFDKSTKILEKKWVVGLGLPFGLEHKGPWTSWMFNSGGFTDSLHPHKRETRGLDTIQATSFFPWWLLLGHSMSNQPRISFDLSDCFQIWGNDWDPRETARNGKMFVLGLFLISEIHANELWAN